MRIYTPPSMPNFRKLARRQLEEALPQHGRPLSSEVELSALNLMEEFVRAQPTCQNPSELSPANLDSLALSYAEQLSSGPASAPGGAGLSPAILKVLSEVNWGLVKEAGPSLTVLGRVEEQAAANSATSPRSTMEWGVEITGYWNDRQLENVRSAVRELGESTGTKALNLLRSVHLRTHLGDLPGGPILGLTSRPGPIALQRAQAENPGATRWLVFHEVGHQLDRFLSGSSKRFRSHASDTPFGKSTRAQDYIDGAQTGSPHEDFADCHAMAIFHHQQIRENPDLYLHARGEVGKKMSWILREGYAEEVPAASPRFHSALSEIEAGLTPFESPDELFRTNNLFLLQPDKVRPEQAAWIRSRLG